MVHATVDTPELRTGLKVTKVPGGETHIELYGLDGMRQAQLRMLTATRRRGEPHCGPIRTHRKDEGLALLASTEEETKLRTQNKPRGTRSHPPGGASSITF